MIRYAVGCIGLVALLACGSSTAGPPAAGTSGNAGDGGTAVALASIGPIDVPAGVEKTVCITKNLGNADDLVVSSITATLASGSHHLIIYRSPDTVENLTPTPCMPFTGLLEGTEPIIIANRLALTWTFPAGVAIELPPNQMLRIEAHYINATAADLQGEGSVTFVGTPKASAGTWTPADFLFWGTANIAIGAGTTATTGPVFQSGIAGTHMISITTHQHELGTGIQAWASATTGDLSDEVVNDSDWTNPSWKPLTPPVDFNGTNGMTFQCAWDNTTDAGVGFGESALDEMCFIGGYYYPSHGFDLCVDGLVPCTGTGR